MNRESIGQAHFAARPTQSQRPDRRFEQIEFTVLPKIGPPACEKSVGRQRFIGRDRPVYVLCFRGRFSSGRAPRSREQAGCAEYWNEYGRNASLGLPGSGNSSGRGEFLARRAPLIGRDGTHGAVCRIADSQASPSERHRQRPRPCGPHLSSLLRARVVFQLAALPSARRACRAGRVQRLLLHAHGIGPLTRADSFKNVLPTSDRPPCR